jgi:parallel beta-helix repeat protein
LEREDLVKRATSGIILFILIIGILEVAFKVEPVRASGVIYIRVDGSIDPSGIPISTVDNITYTFADNINGSIVVEKKNIKIDGNGYILQGSGSGDGFYLSGINNVTIQNVNIKGFNYGIDFRTSSSNLISGNNITNNNEGIYFASSSSNSICGNNITANRDYGIAFGSSSDNSVSGNTIASNSAGLFISSSKHNIVYGNTIKSNNRGIAVWSFSNYNLLYGNNVAGSEEAIIVLVSMHNNIFGNTFANSGYGIWLACCWDNNIFGNNITHNSKGIWLYGPEYPYNNNIYHNNLVSNSQQVRLESQAGAYANAWDNDYPSGGNYWSDYADVDSYSGSYQNETGSDGILDHSYKIGGINKDRYPLTNPWKPTPDFLVTAFPALLSIQQGNSSASTITITSMFGFNHQVELDLTGTPSKITASLSAQFVTPEIGGSKTSTLTVALENTATLGVYTLNVTGTSGTLSHTTPISLNATPALKTFNPPFQLSTPPGTGWHESFGAAQASHDLAVDESSGKGKIVARTWSALGGDSRAFATVAFEDSWVNNWFGESRAKATFNVNGLITWSAISFTSKLSASTISQGLFFNASLRVYDETTSTEIWKEDLDIYHYQSDQEFASLDSYGGDSKSFNDSQYVIQGLLNLEVGHKYSWIFEAQLYTWAKVSDMGESVSDGNLTIDLTEVRIDRMELTSGPAPTVLCEKFLHVMADSSADLLVVDSKGRRVGFDFMTQREVNEIPEAFYSGHGISPQLIEIPLPVAGNYQVFLKGTDVGVYNLSAFLGNLTEEDDNQKFSAFTAIEIPVTTDVIYQYTIDWNALSRGEKGVIVRVDPNGDGNFEYIFTSNSELTQSEFLTRASLILGDLNNDGVVNIQDVVIVSGIYGSTLGESNWNSKADIASPHGKIDILDLVTIIAHYGQKGP